VSVLTRKHQINDGSGLRAQAAHAARQVGPLATKSLPMAQQAVPLAKTAGTSIRQGADGAIAWVTPRVDAARSWAAPQLEQSARAISDSLAPTISSALINAAHKIDAPVRKKPRRRGLIAGTALLLAAAGCGVLVAMRLRQPDEPDAGTMTDEENPPDPDMNGHSQIV